MISKIQMIISTILTTNTLPQQDMEGKEDKHDFAIGTCQKQANGNIPLAVKETILVVWKKMK